MVDGVSQIMAERSRLVCLMGPPGCGKSTAASQLALNYADSVRVLSIGDLIRDHARLDPNSAAAGRVSRGEFVDDGQFLGLIGPRILAAVSLADSRVVLLEGMPRTRLQIRWLDKSSPNWKLV